MTTIPADVLTRVLESADRAPSVHGTRPWWWQGLTDGVALCARPERRLGTTDAEGRDLMISCGAALYSLEVAAAAAGWRAQVHRFPDPTSQLVLAHVRFQQRTPTPGDLARALALEARHTDRRSGASWPVPAERVAQAAKLASTRGVLALPVGAENDLEALLALMAEAAEVQERDRRYAFELERWGQVRRPIDVMDTDAAWLVLATSADEPLSWLRTGEALQAVWLWAVEHGLALLPHSQVLEVATTRRQLQEDLFADTVCPQLVLRLGWSPTAGHQPPVKPAAAMTSAGTGDEGR
jgi:hypothetical protein